MRHHCPFHTQKQHHSDHTSINLKLIWPVISLFISHECSVGFHSCPLTIEWCDWVRWRIKTERWIRICKKKTVCGNAFRCHFQNHSQVQESAPCFVPMRIPLSLSLRLWLMSTLETISSLLQLAADLFPRGKQVGFFYFAETCFISCIFDRAGMSTLQDTEMESSPAQANVKSLNETNLTRLQVA